MVTGVSTGALIAPFASIGGDKSYSSVADFYADPQENWVKKRGALFLLPKHISLFKDLGLQTYIRQQMNDSVIQQVAREADESRLLLIGASNADIGLGRIFDLGRAAQNARANNDSSRVHSILLASSAIPGVFPPVEIDGFYYVDGGVASQVYSILTLELAHGPLVRWRELHPDRPTPTLRLWVVVNEKLRLSPTIMHPQWGKIFRRSLEIMMRSSMLSSLRNIQQLSENARDSLGVDVEFRYVAIPDDAPDPPHGAMFDREFMIRLETLGRQLGADPTSWRSTIPEVHWLDEF